MLRYSLKKRSLILSCVILTLGLPACSSRRSENERKNVILMVIDTLRADHLGCYGYHRNTSPCIDDLSENAHVFASATSQAPWTNPSVVSLLTSLYPSTHHLITLRSDSKLMTLSGNITTLAELLQTEGYSTAAFTANPWLVPEIGVDRGFDIYKNLPMKTRAVGLNEIALEWLRDTAATGLPFFLYIHYMDVHGPYSPPPPFDTLFTSDTSPERTLSEDEFSLMPEYLRLEGLSTLDQYVARYDGGIRYWDECLSIMLDNLSSEGFLQNTILVLTSDHGEEFLEHGGFNHGSTLYQEQVHVPLVWRLPDPAAGSGMIEEPVELVDIAPSLLNMVGLKVPEFLQGTDLTPLMRGGDWLPRPAFSEGTAAFGGVPLPGGSLKSVRSGSLKLISNTGTGETELYDLTRDPRESRERSEEMPAERDRIFFSLQKWIEYSAKAGIRFEAGSFDIGEEIENNLKALGYVDP